VLTKFPKELAGGAGDPGLGSGAVLEGCWGLQLKPNLEFYLFKQ
jgi:hypothetical protein